MSNKLVIVLTKGREDPEVVSTALALGINGLMFDKDVLLVLQGKAISIARKGFLGKMNFPPYEPIVDLLKTFQDNGGRILVCTPGVEGYHVKQDEIIENVMIAGGATFITEIEGAQILSY